MKKSILPLCKCHDYFYNFDNTTFCVKAFLTIGFPFISCSLACGFGYDMYENLKPIRENYFSLFKDKSCINDIMLLQKPNFHPFYYGAYLSFEEWRNSSSKYLKYAKEYQEKNQLKSYDLTVCQYSNVENIFFFIESHSNVSWSTFFIEIFIPLLLVYSTLSKLDPRIQIVWITLLSSWFLPCIFSNIARLMYTKCLVWYIQCDGEYSIGQKILCS